MSRLHLIRIQGFADFYFLFAARFDAARKSQPLSRGTFAQPIQYPSSYRRIPRHKVRTKLRPPLFRPVGNLTKNILCKAHNSGYMHPPEAIVPELIRLSALESSTTESGLL
jgi:hypothetical protein